MKLPYLGFLASTPPHDLQITRVLGSAEYEEYEKKANRLIGFLSDYLQFEMVRKSHAEYIRSVAHYEREYAERLQLNDVTPDQVTHELNRRLRSFFTEFYFFLEYAQRTLQGRHGKNSIQAREWKQATSVQFDSSFAYRFVYHLRHYAQHVNIPLSVLSLSTEGPAVPNAGARYHLEVQVDRDELLHSGFRWRTHDIKPQLLSLPPRFGLNSYVDEMMECLERLNVSFVCASLPDAKRDALYILNLIEPCIGRGRPCMFGEEELELLKPTDNKGRGGIARDVHWIPVELAAMVARLPEREIFSRYSALQIDFAFRDHQGR